MDGITIYHGDALDVHCAIAVERLRQGVLL